MVAPAAAAITVTIAGAITPGYSAAQQTISRLAVPGKPAGFAVQLAIGITAVACFALASAVSKSRWPLVAAGLGFGLAAVVRLDPASAQISAAHRIGSGLAVTGLVAAAATYGHASRTVAAGEVALLLGGGVLLFTSFDAWGLWERSLLALALGWMTIVAARTMVSSDEMATAIADSSSSAGM